MIGKTLAHYRIVEKIGAGGMGEVYRAHDLKLGRDVAIKVLPQEMSGDPERLARFDREARTLATLQHPNVASIYGFETAGDVRFLIMELVEGEDLSERLLRGAMPAEESVELAIQLAEGLAAAHAVGVIHRDLKPANIKISPDGKLKILDFGLARAYAGDAGAEPDAEHSPTITAAMTGAGVILGTAAYMSPEQARGKSVDHRADIWAFGVVLFEMLTGRRVFEGETVSDTLAAVLRADPPWERLPKKTGATVRRLLERCLARDPSRRLQAIAEARIALEDVKAGRADEAERLVSTRFGDARPRRKRLIWIAIVAGLLAVVAAMALRTERALEAPLVQSTLMPPDGWDFEPGSPFAVSPDGRRIAFVATARSDTNGAPAEAPSGKGLWVRDLAEPDSRLIADGHGLAFPFWSPDGRWLGFFGGGKLNKIEAKGGPVIPLCTTGEGRGGTWNDAGTIIFQRDWSRPLTKIPAGGGTPEPATILDTERLHMAHRWPHFLPDGRSFLFYAVSQNSVTSEYSGIYVGSLDSKESRLLLKTESRALYSSGHLLYRAGSTLMAHPFDPSRQEFTGDPTPVTTDIPGGAISWGGAQFGVSESGLLVHLRGSEAANSQLNWRDRDGNILGTVGGLDSHYEPAISHDGTRVAWGIGQDIGDIWIHDVASGRRTRFTFDPADDRDAIWSGDDSQIAFSSPRTAAGEIYARPTSGQGDSQLLFQCETNLILTDWSRDERFIFFSRVGPDDQGWDIWVLDLQTSKAEPFVAGKYEQSDARLSPDGKWIAYTSDESGESEIYVQGFPDSEGRRVASDGGSQPTWREDGRELYYMNKDAILAVSVSGDDALSFGPPRVLFNVSVKSATGARYAVSGDGQRFLTNDLPPTDPSKIGARLMQNWTAALAP